MPPLARALLRLGRNYLYAEGAKAIAAVLKDTKLVHLECVTLPPPSALSL